MNRNRNLRLIGCISIVIGYFNIAVKYSDRDAEKAMESLKCHTSQVSPEMIKRKEGSGEKSNYTSYLREFIGPEKIKKAIFD